MHCQQTKETVFVVAHTAHWGQVYDELFIILLDFNKFK